MSSILASKPCHFLYHLDSSNLEVLVLGFGVGVGELGGGIFNLQGRFWGLGCGLENSSCLVDWCKRWKQGKLVDE